ncbi:MAG: helix-turn-helix domain-containing protein [Notoacmeibacter sp.]|nr:helix-turn-helix domain-containing protein [Notoacmeibacter sp.]
MTELSERYGGVGPLADKAGIKRNTMYTWASGDREPRASDIVQIADKTGCSALWLLTGQGSSFDGGSGFIPIPRLDVRASAGGGRLAVIEDEEAQVVAFRSEWLRRLGVSPQHAQIIIADGDSMVPTIGHGDLVLLDRSIERIVDDGIYVLVYNGLVKLKRVQLLRSGTVLLKSDNAQYETEEVSPHELPELIIEGRVRWAGGAI